MPRAEVNGVEVAYHRGGRGPRLLYLNGSGTTLAAAMPLLKPFEERFDLVAADHRGMGESSAPAAPWSMADHAADALGLMDHLGWASCRVVGVSFGGMVAQELAVAAPDRVERLGLLCTSPGGAGGSSYPLHELADLPVDEKLARYPLLLDTRFTPEFLATDSRGQAVARLMAGRLTAERTPDQTWGEAQQMIARRGHDVWDRLGAITCPTLVACGETDGIAPRANSEAIASRVPAAELRVYRGGHPFFVQDRAAIPEIIDFLATSD